MNNNQDIDMNLRKAFDKIRITEQKEDSYIVEPRLTTKKLEEMYKAEKERKIIIAMSFLAVFLFNFSTALFIGTLTALTFWIILVIASVFSIVGFSVILLFLTLNKFYTIKEVMY